MIKVGTLCRTKPESIDAGKNLCEILSTWNKRDIDPECPQSIAIIGMVKAIWLTGPNQGQEFSRSQKNFRLAMEVVS